jgi:DNA-binding HxlR family transcriptional regulator
MNTHPQELLIFLKLLADESRLTLLRLLNQQEYNVGDLAKRVDLGEPTVSHHLSKLRQAGLVSLRMEGNQRFYRLNQKGLARFKSQVARIEQFPPEPEAPTSDESWIKELGWSAEESKVLHDYTQNGKLTRIPSKRGKLLVILRWLATLFQPDTLYSEAEVNDLIKSVHAEDYVGLRRDLVDWGYLRRERGGGKYWLAPAEEDHS